MKMTNELKTSLARGTWTVAGKRCWEGVSRR